MADKRKKPEPIGAAIESFLTQAGIASRVEQASVVPEWESLVGSQIAAVTAPHRLWPSTTINRLNGSKKVTWRLQKKTSI